MNDKHPVGRRSTCIAELCERVEELERENAELRARTQTELAALARKWQDVVYTLLEVTEKDAVQVPVSSMKDSQLHPFFAGKLSVLRHFATLADADVARFTEEDQDHD